MIDLEPIEDSRGFFARAWSEEELAAHGLETRIAQCNISFNERREPCGACISSEPRMRR